jgi:hypothetical protein
MLTTEQLHDPTFAFQEGAEFADHFQISYDPLRDTLAYEGAMYALKPSSGQQLLRYEVEGRGTAPWRPEDAAIIEGTAERLGIKQDEYPFTPGTEYDAVVTIPGARNSIKDRAEYGYEALASGIISARRLLVVDDARKLKAPELAAVADWAPEAATTSDLSDIVAGNLRERNELPGDTDVDVFTTQNLSPDARSIVNEVILRGGIHRGGRVAIIGNGFFAPAMTHRGDAAGLILGVSVDTVGAPSRPEVAAERGTDSYMNEVTNTLMSAAQNQFATRALRRAKS